MTDTQTLNIRPPVWALIVAVAVGGAFYLAGKNIEVKDHTPTMISVDGEGKVYAAPDIASLTFGLQTGPRTTAKEAMKVLNDSMSKIFAAVKATGVDQKDIATQQFSLDPQYDWNNGTQTLRGYAATQTLQVKVRDLDKVSDVLAAATNAGANQAGNVSFTIDKPETVRAQARELAIAQAKEKAQKLASDLGMSLGKLKGFSEGGTTPIYYRNDMKSEALGMGGGPVAAPAPVLPQGQQEVISDVTLNYELN